MADNQDMSKPKSVVLTCAQPTGMLTLGNYLGAIRNWSTMLENHQCFFGIVDLHAITSPYTPAVLRKMSTIALLSILPVDWIPKNVSCLSNLK